MPVVAAVRAACVSNVVLGEVADEIRAVRARGTGGVVRIAAAAEATNVTFLRRVLRRLKGAELPAAPAQEIGRARLAADARVPWPVAVERAAARVRRARKHRRSAVTCAAERHVGSFAPVQVRRSALARPRPGRAARAIVDDPVGETVQSVTGGQDRFCRQREVVIGERLVDERLSAAIEQPLGLRNRGQGLRIPG